MSVGRTRRVRFRTLGCYPLTGAIESDATTLPAIIQDAHLTPHGRQSPLRLITCGGVDDGQSTLIGRLLFEAKSLPEDQLAALAVDSRKSGTGGDDIDVAYRSFSTERRKYVVADTPGDEQYTCNMVTGASTADLAIVLIDARKGVLIQTRRHSFLVSLLGIRHVVLAVNKMDLVDYSAAVSERIEADYRAFAAQIGIKDIRCIPMSAVHGDNVFTRSERTPWYQGPSLMEHLESVPIDHDLTAGPFRMPVQWVGPSRQDFRGFGGAIASGTLRVGDQVVALPSGRGSRVRTILDGASAVADAVAGQSVTVMLADALDISRGDVLVAAHARPGVAAQFEATIVWMSDEPMLPGRSYLLKTSTQTVAATVAPLKHRVNLDTLEHVAARKLDLNDIGVCGLQLAKPIVFEPYATSRDLGGFILIDRITTATVGAGLIHFALRRSQNVHWQALDVDRQVRADLKGQKPCVLWFTGLSGAGKSTIANLVEKRLALLGRHTYLLDGDNVRHGLNKDLGFTDTDRVENIRRVAEVARLMADAGLIVLVAFISPFRAERRMARGLMADGEFIEVFVDTPLAVAETRDPKGLYKKARRGELENFTGVDSPYEAPEQPEIRVDTTRMPAEEAAEHICHYLSTQGVLTSS